MEVTNLLVFSLKGELIHAALNYPSCRLDSIFTHYPGLIYCTLHDDQTTPRKYAILSDSAFTARAAMDNKILQTCKTNEDGDVLKVEMLAVDLIKQKVFPSERQSAECGIRAFKARFGLLQFPRSPDLDTIGLLLQVCPYLLNLCTQSENVNQIKTIYSNRNENYQPRAGQLMEEQNNIQL